jgi:hypothetical protein
MMSCSVLELRVLWYMNGRGGRFGRHGTRITTQAKGISVDVQEGQREKSGCMSRWVEKQSLVRPAENEEAGI